MVHVGRAIPLQFSLGGNQGMSQLATGYPTAQQVSCATGVPINTSTETDTAVTAVCNATSPPTLTPTCAKTSMASKGTCQIFTLGLADGTFYTANFQYVD